MEWKETPKKDYVLYFGRFSEEKGIGTLIKVCKELPDVQFIFAGTGPLEKTVNGIKNIKNVGFQKGEALEKLIREARFSIYPSEWYENCPFSVMESQMYGTPVGETYDYHKNTISHVILWRRHRHGRFL